MPRSSRSRLNLSDEEKKKRRREQKKNSMRRARAKLDAAALEERRRKDRERYERKKRDGLIKTINDFTPRQQRQIRKIWREKSKVRREKEKIRKRTEEILKDTPPSSPSSSFSRIQVGRAVSAQNRRRLKAKNEYLTRRLQLLENKLAKYRMRLLRLKRNKQEPKTSTVTIKEAIHNFLLDDENSRLTAGKKETITRRKVKKQIRLLNDSLLNLYKIFINKSGLSISYETFRRYRPFWVLFPKAASRDTCLCSIHTNNDYIVDALHRTKILPYSTATDVAKSLCCNGVLNVSCLERKCAQCSEKTVDINLINGDDTITYQRWITKNVTVTVKGQEKQCRKTLKERVKTSREALVDILNSNLPKFMQHLANIINQFRAIRFIKQNLTPSDGLLHIDFSENYGYKYGTETQGAHFGGSKGQLSLHTCVYYSTDSEPPQNIIKTTSICTVSQNLRHDPVLICAHLKPVIEQIKLLTPALKELHILSDGPSTQYRNKTMFQMIVNYLSKISNAETIIWHFSETGHGKGAPDGVGGCLKRIADKAVANGRDIADISSFVDCSKVNCKGIVVIPIDDVHIPEIQNIADAITVRPFKGTFQVHQISWSMMEPNILHARRLSCILCAAHTKCSHFEIGQIPVHCIQLPRTSSSSASRSAVASPDIQLPGTPSSSASRAAVASPGIQLPGTPSSSASGNTEASPINSSPGTASASTISGPRTPQPLMETPSPDSSLNVRQPLTPTKRLNFNDVYSDDSDSSSLSKLFMRRPATLGDSNDKYSSSKKAKRRLAVYDKSDDEYSPPKKATRRPTIFVDSDEENSPPKKKKRHPVIYTDSDDENSPPKKAKRSEIKDFFSDDSNENIF